MNRNVIHSSASSRDKRSPTEKLRINGLAPNRRVAARQEHSRPLIVALKTWLREQRAKPSAQSKTAQAITYCLTRWAVLTRFLNDGRICMSNNAAEREIRAVALGRKNWIFAGSDAVARRRSTP